MTTPSTITPNLAASLVKAQAQMQAVAKGSKNSHHGYKYTSSEDIIDAARDVLNENSLSYTVESASYVATPGEAVWNAVGLLVMVFLLEHASGEQRRVTADIPVCPERGRPLDKALFAARTEGLGYGLRDLLLIPRKDAEDISGRHDRDDVPAVTRPAVTSAPKQAAPRPQVVKPAQSILTFDQVYSNAVAAGKAAADAKSADAWQAARKRLIADCQGLNMADAHIQAALVRFKAATTQAAVPALPASPTVKSTVPREAGDDTDAEKAAAIDRGAA